VPESAEPQNDFSPEASIPESTAPLESIIRTEELHRRPGRPPDFETENRALVALATALSHSASIPDTLQDVFLIEKNTKKFPDTKGLAYAAFDCDPASDTTWAKSRAKPPLTRSKPSLLASTRKENSK
jgi:hypothetical protein